MESSFKEMLSYRKRRWILLCTILCVFLLVLCFFHISRARALIIQSGDVDFGGVAKITEEDYDAMLEQMNAEYCYLNRLDSLFSSDFDEAAGTGSLMYSILKAPNSPVKTAGNITMVIGACMILLNLSIQLLRLFQREEKSIEVLAQILMIAFISLLAVIYIEDILNIIEQMGETVWKEIKTEAGLAVSTELTVNKVTTASETVEGSPSMANYFSNIKNVFSNVVNIFSNIAESVRNVIYAKLAGLVGRVGLYFTFFSIVTSAYGLIIELCIRKLFAPIAVADIMTGGLRSVSIQFLRNYLGMYLRIAAMFVIVSLGLFCQKWASTTGMADQAFQVNSTLGPIGVCICSRMAVKALMNTSGSLIRDAVSGSGGE